MLMVEWEVRGCRCRLIVMYEYRSVEVGRRVLAPHHSQFIHWVWWGVDVG